MLRAVDEHSTKMVYGNGLNDKLEKTRFHAMYSNRNDCVWTASMETF